MPQKAWGQHPVTLLAPFCNPRSQSAGGAHDRRGCDLFCDLKIHGTGSCGLFCDPKNGFCDWQPPDFATASRWNGGWRGAAGTTARMGVCTTAFFPGCLPLECTIPGNPGSFFLGACRLGTHLLPGCNAPISLNIKKIARS